MTDLETWEVWYPYAASTGLHFARGRLDPTQVLLVHAVPDVLTVEVRDSRERRIAFGQDLSRTLQSPVCLLRRDGAEVVREDVWPTGEHAGKPIMLPGGEVGILKSWWNADDRKDWRWQIELYNSIR